MVGNSENSRFKDSGFQRKPHYAIIPSMNTSYIIFAAVVLYLVGGLVLGFRLFAAQGSKLPPRIAGIALGFAAVILHATVLYFALHTDQGINLGFFNAISLAAWLIVLIFLFSALGKPLEALGVFLLPVAALTLLLALHYPSARLLGPDSSWQLHLHVLTSLLAYSVLTMASVQAVLLAVQDSQLRKHHPGGFIRALPPLQTMESLMFEMIMVGFVLLSAALLSGFLFLENMFTQRLAHKTILSIIAWILFSTLLWGRYRFGWRGRIAIRWTLAGFIVLALAYFGSKAVMELILAG